MERVRQKEDTSEEVLERTRLPKRETSALMRPTLFRLEIAFSSL